MFGRCPWGGYGANPIPASIQADWDSHGHLITGGMPYQEGIYLDINQVTRQGLYWSGRPTNETLRSYARFEFGWEAADAVTEAVAILEPTYAMIGSDQSQRALDLLRSAMPSMTDAAKRSWRWRILYLRALIDALAYNGTSMFKNGTVHGSSTTAGPLKAAFGELDRIYHVERDCCHPGGPADCTDSVDTQANCTILALRPGLSTLAAEVECSDRRVKHELQRLGTSASGVPLFSWRYLPGFGLETSRRYAGTTAQSLLELGRHDAVVPNACGAGLHGVDYSRLDVAFVPVACKTDDFAAPACANANSTKVTILPAHQLAGANIDFFKCESVDACLQACCARSGCAAFDWTSFQQGDRPPTDKCPTGSRCCWLKNGHGGLPAPISSANDSTGFVRHPTPVPPPPAPPSAALPLPTAAQLNWAKGGEFGISALVHYNMATYAEPPPGLPLTCFQETWADLSSPKAFAPSDLDCDDWASAMQLLGIKEAVLTAKHGCGFTLWPTNVSLPDGTRYPYHSSVDVLSLFVKSM